MEALAGVNPHPKKYQSTQDWQSVLGPETGFQPPTGKNPRPLKSGIPVDLVAEFTLHFYVLFFAFTIGIGLSKMLSGGLMGFVLFVLLKTLADAILLVYSEIELVFKQFDGEGPFGARGG